MRDGIRRSAGYFLIFICIGLDMALLGPTLPALAGQTGSTIGVMGIVFFIGACGFSLGTLLGGWLFDWAPARRILVVGQCIVGGLVFFTPHIPWFGLLMALYLVKGIAGGTVHVGVNTLMLWTHGEKSSPFVNALHFFFGLGAFLSPFLLGLLINSGGGYADAFHLLAAADFLVAAFLFFRLEPPPPARQAERREEAAPLAAGLLAPLVVSAMLYLFFYVSAEITFGGWIYTYAVRLGLADAASAAFLTSIFWLFFTAGRLLSIPAAVRIPPARIIPIALTGCAVFLGGLILFPASHTGVWIAAAGTGFCMAPVWPSGFTLAGRSVPLTARLSGFILLGDSIGGMILPGLTGFIIDRAGAPALAQLVLAGITGAFLAFLGILFSGRRIRKADARL
jgi:FHS family Na+ dependent glucose MFS transporter 1